MVHRLVSVGTVEKQALPALRLTRRPAAGILYEKYRNEIASKIRGAHTASDERPAKTCRRPAR
ncbi:MULTISPECIES: hypothetical protein [Burkholderia]|uniref:hypothetical protein n=1 Tax=Burkholderia TaxID=32008 RepID=UPI001916AF7B|nr:MULTISPECIES: hypothetical protein [Burkholderia]